MKPLQLRRLLAEARRRFPSYTWRGIIRLTSKDYKGKYDRASALRFLDGLREAPQAILRSVPSVRQFRIRQLHRPRPLILDGDTIESCTTTPANTASAHQMTAPEKWQGGKGQD